MEYRNIVKGDNVHIVYVSSNDGWHIHRHKILGQEFTIIDLEKVPGTTNFYRGHMTSIKDLKTGIPEGDVYTFVKIHVRKVDDTKSDLIKNRRDSDIAKINLELNLNRLKDPEPDDIKGWLKLYNEDVELECRYQDAEDTSEWYSVRTKYDRDLEPSVFKGKGRTIVFRRKDDQ